jgi:short-subunit dehydrogenase
MENILKGKNVLITGATGGLGREFCYQLAKEKTNLFITSKTESKLNSLKEELLENGISCKSIVADFNFNVEHLIKFLNNIDILVNNAGVYIDSSLENSTIDDYDELFNVNVKVPFILIKECSKQMKIKSWGRIINIGSNSSYVGTENNTLYCSTKHAILGLSRAVHQELKYHNIKSFCFSPGGLQTNMGKNLSNSVEYPLFIEPNELVQYIVHTIKYDSHMVVDEVKINRVGA